MAGYQTGHAELIAAAGELQSSNEDLMEQLRQLATAVDAVGSQWEGMARTAFNNLITRFQQDATTLNNKLVDMAEAVTGSATAYQAQEDNAAQSLSAITNTLG